MPDTSSFCLIGPRLCLVVVVVLPGAGASVLVVRRAASAVVLLPPQCGAGTGRTKALAVEARHRSTSVVAYTRMLWRCYGARSVAALRRLAIAWNELEL